MVANDKQVEVFCVPAFGVADLRFDPFVWQSCLNRVTIHMDQNPYAVQSTSYLAPELLTDVESIRKRYLGHEASVKSIGTLYVLGGVLSLLLSIGYIVGGVMIVSNAAGQNPDPTMPGIFLSVLGCIVFALAVLQLWSGLGVRQLKPAARVGASFVAGIGLLGFPLGTLISAYFLYLLLSEKGAYVFSDTYKQVIAQTPHMKYRTSILVWILVALLVTVVLVAIIAVIAGSLVG
jgi:hypothetical protein